MHRNVNQPTIKIELTPEQKEQVRRATGTELPVIKLQPEELEERVAPTACCNGRHFGEVLPP